jgi:2-polyprenyl-6-hydroxyphenyl methylase / 3-demethylubiquinone-9 3-methyltransferase
MVNEAAESSLQPPSVDPAEVAKFSALAAEWWNPNGKFGVLHKFNPVRLAYLREQITARFARDPFHRLPFAGLDLLDIGCGGGLLSEPMARLGARVTAIDPSHSNIKTAMVHAVEQGLDIDYLVATAEELALAAQRFDVILNMEVIEHVNEPNRFLRTCASLLKPGGLMFTATINRTLKSFALAIIGAEYVLGWLPRGTHQWEKFLNPDELLGGLAAARLKPLETIGVVYNMFTGEWQRSRDTDVNYIVLASKLPKAERA